MNTDDKALVGHLKGLSQRAMTTEQRESVVEALRAAHSADYQQRGGMRMWFMSGIGLAAIALAMVLFLPGNLASHEGVDQPRVPGVTFTVPAQIQWGGHVYNTRSWVKAVGKRLGLTQAPGNSKVFSIPGVSPDREIAIELDYPNGKYISAFRSSK